jgi:predicted MPP superfamily phosphohydrolase
MRMPLLSIILFLLIVVGIYLGMHYFVYWRITSGLRPSTTVRIFIAIAFLALASSYFLARFFERSVLSVPLTYVGSVWMGIIAIALSVFILQMIASWMFPRYVVLLTYVTILVVVLASGYSLYNGLRQPRIRELHIPISKLPKSLDGFSIVQLADIHLERSKSPRWWDSVVNRVNNLHPDLILIVGDLVDEDIRSNSRFVDAIGRLQSPNGVVAVTGNHEYYAGFDAFVNLCDSLGILLLRNSSMTIANSIELIGVNDDAAKQVGEAGVDLDKAMENCDTSKATILMCHRPLYFEQAVAKGVDLQLSGHVHVGQLPPMDVIVMLVFKYYYGLHRKGTSHIYTTSGTGTWGPPMRLFSRSEIVYIQLRSPEFN